MSEKSFLNRLNKIANANRNLPNKLGARAVLFSKNRFRKQNWIDKTVEPWKKRLPTRGESKDRSKRGTLMDTVRLFRSVRKIHVSQSQIIIGTDVPYAKAHNEGVENKTVSVKAYVRKSRTGNVHKVKAHTKTMNLPKRQFMGKSALLTSLLRKMVVNEYKNALK